LSHRITNQRLISTLIKNFVLFSRTLNNLKNLRGTVDLLPDQLIKWQNVKKILLEQLARASIKEIRTPILEMTELFKRGIGEGTDVVSKEMYTFLDKGETFGTIESVKAVEEVYLPFSGKIVSVNESVIDNPELLQNDPIGEGWLIVIKPDSKVSFDDLMTSDAYKSKVLPN